MSFFERENKLKAVTFSFDDGVTQDLRLIYLLDKYGLKCTFNINSDLLGKRGLLKRPSGQVVSHYKIYPEELCNLYTNHEIAAHTLTHPRLPELDDADVIKQVEQDRINLSKIVGYDVVGLAYPCGGKNFDDRVKNLIKNNTGIKYCRTIISTNKFDMPEDLYAINPTMAHIADFENAMKLAKEFVESKPDKPQVFYIWGHSYEMDIESDRWVKLEELFKFISNRDDIFYGTNKEVFL